METAVDKHQALKDLALKFDESSDPQVFVRVLLKVDKLLKFQIWQIRRRNPHLCEVDFYDLYQTAVIGLYRALAKVREDEPGGKLIYNIRRYIDNEIVKDYKDPSRSLVCVPFDVVQDELFDTTEVYADLEREFIRDRFEKLIKDGVISQEEFAQVHKHFVEGVSYKDTARRGRHSTGTISKKVRDSLNRLRFEFRRRHWEEG